MLCAAFIAASFTAFSQFSETGYKFLKLGTQEKNLKTQMEYKRTGDEAKGRYDNLQLELYFYENKLYSIKSFSPAAKLEGVSEALIGKHYKQVKAILGTRLTSSDFSERGEFPGHYVYYRNAGAANKQSSCVLDFNSKGILESITAVYNP